MIKKRVLFVCIHNSARSQMAEALLNATRGDAFEAFSAGFEPGTLNPLAVAAMQEAGVDLSRAQTKSVFDLFKSGQSYHYVITVCDESSAERCPIFPGVVRRLHWSFDDPSAFQGTWDEKLARTRRVRDKIKETVEDFAAKVESGAMPANFGF